MRTSKLLLLLGVIFISQQVNAQDYSAKGKCTQGNCRSGFGIIKFSNGDRYEGNWRDSEMHGQGTYYHANGATYIGEYKEGKRHGYGTYRWPEGDMYIGEYVNNNKEGCGQYIFAANRGKIKIQEGYFSDNKFMGKGSTDCPILDGGANIRDKHSFNLESEESRSDENSTGVCVTGNCKFGYGVFVFKNGDRYEGDFKNGMKHGQGTYTTKGGDTYQGMYKDDRRHGYGTYRWTNGAIYIGEYEFGKRNGRGQFIDEHGTIQEGYYVDNKYVGTIKGNENEQDAQSVIPEKEAPKSPAALGWLNPDQNGQSVNGCCFIVEACIAQSGSPVRVKIFNNDEVVATLTAKDFKKETGTCPTIIRHPILLNAGENNLYFKVEGEAKSAVFSESIVIHKGGE